MTRPHPALLASSALLAMALGCPTGRPAATAEDLLQREAEFEAAIASGEIERFRSFIDAEAVFLESGGDVASGREAFVAKWRPILEQPATRLTWEPRQAALSDDATLGYTHGAWRMTREGTDGAALLATGRYATIWRRGDDGVWRVVLDVGTTDETPRAERTF
jgi:ketosteroid isomerase-like protein